jgi:ABC-type transporter Mla subunit MlaD
MINTTELERIAGAKCCTDVLQRANKDITSVMKMDESVADAFRKKDAVLGQILASAGLLSPQAAGVLSALAEFAIDGIQNGYSICEQLDDDWLPEATMTAQEVEAAREDFAARCKAGAAS